MSIPVRGVARRNSETRYRLLLSLLNRLIERYESFSSSSLVKILVGEGADQKKYAAHKSFLVKRSKFFRAALSGDRWTEAETREIKLPEDKPHIFALYLRFIYTGRLGKIHTPLNDPSSVDLPTFTKILGVRYTYLFNFYILGEKLMDVAAKNISIATIFVYLTFRQSHKNIYPGPSYLASVYEGTPVGSPCRRFLIDIVSRLPGTVLEEDFKINMDLIPKEALADLSIALAKGSVDPIEKGVEAYLEASD